MPALSSTRCSSIFLVLALLTWVPLIRGQVYQITDLGTLPGQSSSTAVAINQSGQIAGTSGQRSFIYTIAGMTDLGVLPGSNQTIASAINNKGQIVGEYTLSTLQGHGLGFLWDNGVISDPFNSEAYIGSLFETQNFSPAAINDSGQVAVDIESNGHFDAQLWQVPGNQITELVPSGSSTAYAINNVPQVALVNQTYYTFGEIWSPSGTTTIPYIDYAFAGYGPTPYGINDNGQAVGVVLVYGGSHAFLFANGVTSDLGTLGGTNSAARAINNTGQIVGDSDQDPNTATTSNTHAFLYANGSMTDLNSLVANPAGWELQTATGINDSGQIVGNGTYANETHGFLLTPITQVTTSPSLGGNTGDVTINVFYPGATPTSVELDCSGGKTVLGTSVIPLGPGAIQVTFTLTGVQPGACNLILNEADGTTITSSNAFTVEQGGAPEISIQLIGPSFFRAGNQASYIALIQNSGLVDAPLVESALSFSEVSQSAFQSEGFQSVFQLAGPGLSLNSVGALSQTAIPFSIGAPNLLQGAKCENVIDRERQVRPVDQCLPLKGAKLASQATLSSLYSQRLLNAEKLIGSLLPVSFTGGVGSCFNPGSSAFSNYYCQSLRQQDNRLKDKIDMSNAAQNAVCALAAALGCDLGCSNPLPSAVTLLGNLAGGVDATFDSISSAYPPISLPLQTQLNAYLTQALALPSSLVFPALPPPPPPPLTPDNTFSLQVCADSAADPNSKIGSSGVGAAQYARGTAPLPYAISFENEPTASASAATVAVSDQLDPNLDATTLSINSIQIGPISLPLFNMPPVFTTRLDLRPTTNMLVDAQVSVVSNLLTVVMNAIDPATGLPPTDPTAGFLPPDSSPPAGEGTISYTVMPKPNVPTGTQIQNQAKIVFDTNAPIPTQTWLNTIDNAPPVSHVLALPADEVNLSFTVTWSGTDVGAGVQNYTVYVSDNGGAFTAWQTNTTATSAIYAGQVGHTYAFYSIARDLTGNIEAAKTAAEATTLVVNATPALLTSPAPGSTLTGPSATFTWSTVTGATGYSLWLGSTGAGSNNLWHSGETTATSVKAGGLPTNGETIYARLYTSFNNVPVHTDYIYTAVTQAPAALTTPTPSSTLAGPNVTFTWSASAGASGYSLWLGSTGAGSNNLWHSGETTASSATAGGLPTNGETIYARLYTSFNKVTVHVDYTYTAATWTPAALTTPTPSSTLAGPNVTFTWSASAGASGYSLWLGSTGAGSHDLWHSGETTATSATAGGLPLNGETIYARLYTDFNGVVQHADYTYTAVTQTQAALSSPEPGSTLTGTNVTFTWSAGIGASGYSLWLGTTPGANDVYNSHFTAGLSATATKLPANGETIYARLYTNYSGKVKYIDYTYTAAP